MRLPRARVAILALALFAAPYGARADTAAPVMDPTAVSTPDINPPEQSHEGTEENVGGNFTPLFAPIPFKNTQVGWGLALMVGAIHRFDPDTTYKPSTGMVTGFYTENKSWGVAAIEIARLAHDRWRLRGLVSHMDIHYDFYGIGEDAGDEGVALGIEQTMDFAVLSGLRRVMHGTYLGAAGMWLSTTAHPKGAVPPELPDLPGDFSHATLVAPGLQGEVDTRDNDYWPGHGTLAKLKGWFYTSSLGSSRDFQRYTAFWSWYTHLGGSRFVLATNANSQAAAGDAPFYVLPSIGAGQGGLRGYTQGRYRDRLTVTGQLEVRYHTSGRLGATAFGGIGAVAPQLSDLGKAEGLPAGGVGARYQLTRNYPMHLRFDYAWGKNGGLFYFSAAEAF
jgi:hypothetical protein